MIVNEFFKLQKIANFNENCDFCTQNTKIGQSNLTITP